MIIADTNVLSEPWRKSPAPRVLAWLLAHESHPGVTTITLTELRSSVERLTEGNRKRLLAREIDKLAQAVSGRIFDFDEAASEAYAKLRAERDASGRRVSVEDTMIAAICLAHGHELVTRNTRDFDDTGIPLINPW